MCKKKLGQIFLYCPNFNCSNKNGFARYYQIATIKLVYILDSYNNLAIATRNRLKLSFSTYESCIFVSIKPGKPKNSMIRQAI